MMVVCRAASAIAAAFGAPLAGAFYGFELIIGTYTATALAPVLTASIAGALVAHIFGVEPYAIAMNQGIGVQQRRSSGAIGPRFGLRRHRHPHHAWCDDDRVFCSVERAFRALFVRFSVGWSSAGSPL